MSILCLLLMKTIVKLSIMISIFRYYDNALYAIIVNSNTCDNILLYSISSDFSSIYTAIIKVPHLAPLATASPAQTCWRPTSPRGTSRGSMAQDPGYEPRGHSGGGEGHGKEHGGDMIAWRFGIGKEVDSRRNSTPHDKYLRKDRNYLT